MSAPKPGDRVAVLHDCRSDFAADGIVRHETPVLVTSVLRNKAERTRIKGVRCDNSLIEWWVGDDAEWRCPDCPWVHAAHPDYGWQKHDDRAVEVHQTKLCPQRRRDGGDQ